MFIASSLSAQQRVTAGDVAVTIPSDWRAATRAELAKSGDTPPLLVVIGPANASVAILRSQVPEQSSPMQVAGTSMMNLLLQLNDASVATPLHETTVAGLPAAEWVASYKTAKPDDSRARVICVLRGGAEYTIVASGPAENREAIDDVVKSFAFGK